MNVHRTTDNGRAEFKRRRDAGLKARHATRLARWEGIDSWLTRWEAQQDPHGQYGTPGRDPQNVIRGDAA